MSPVLGQGMYNKTGVSLPEKVRVGLESNGNISKEHINHWRSYESILIQVTQTIGWTDSLKRNDSLNSLKYLPTKYLLFIRGKKSTCALEKPGRHLLHKVVKVNITSDGANWNHVSDRVQWEEYSIASEKHLPKMHDWIPLWGKIQHTHMEGCFIK